MIRQWKWAYILSSPRSGSTILSQMLGSHPDINVALKEFYHKNNLGLLKKIAKRFPRQYLAYQAKRSFGNMKIDRAGVKIMYHHIYANPILIDVMKRDDAVVVHLIRRNSFLQYVSMCEAQENQKWHYSHDEKFPDTTLTLGVKNMYDFISRVERNKQHYRSIFPNAVILYYEDFLIHPESFQNKLLSALSLPRYELAYSFRKSGIRPFPSVYRITSSCSRL